MGTPSFVLKLKLNTNHQDELELAHRFYCGQQIYNVLVRHCKKSLRCLQQDREYQTLLKERRTIVKQDTSDKPVDKKIISDINTQLSMVRRSYGLSEYQLHNYVKIQQCKYKKHIDSMTAQRIATAVWRSVEKYLFGNGNNIWFKRYDDTDSLEGKSNASGIRYRNGRMYWNGLVIQPQIRTEYERYALQNRIKYCRVSRISVGCRFHYYLQLVLEGTPPQKNVLGSGTGGIDIGTSTAAIVTDEQCRLLTLGDGCNSHEQELRRINRKADRSRRATNPQNYNADGTVKQKRSRWVISKSYKKLMHRKRDLHRRYSASVEQSHTLLANAIIAEADTFYVEKMSMSGLAKKSKLSKKQNGQYNRRKRFGKSIGHHAPAKFLSIVNKKLSYFGRELWYVNTQSFKASQYNHLTDEYVKKKLSKRYTFIGDDWVQRDLYSAFLLKNSLPDLNKTDRQQCIKDYPEFIPRHNLCMDTIVTDNNYHPSSFGCKEYRHYKLRAI